VVLVMTGAGIGPIAIAGGRALAPRPHILPPRVAARPHETLGIELLSLWTPWNMVGRAVAYAVFVINS
jgi:hypothetical protein